MSQTPPISQDLPKEQPQIERKRPFLSPRTRLILGISVIALLVVLSFFAPPEGDTSNVTGDPASVPTVTITNPVETVNINRVVSVKGVQITVMRATVATSFSDDHKRLGAYTVRVMVGTVYNGHVPLGIDYASLVRLQTPDGALIEPKLLSVKPVEIAGRPQSGFLDFPLAAPVPLSELKLYFGRDTVVPL